MAHSQPGAGSEYDRLFDHSYDGIQEYDNPLPGWWTWLFVLSIIFSVLYFMYYHIGIGPTVEDRYETQMARQVSNQLAQLGDLQADDATIMTFVHRQDWMNAMGGIFRGQCAQCHAADGGGNVGPNLTDDMWKNVRAPRDIYRVISQGIPGTSMPAFGDRFREPQLILLASYVASLRGTTPAQPKPPEGARTPPWPTFEELGVVIGGEN